MSMQRYAASQFARPSQRPPVKTIAASLSPPGVTIRLSTIRTAKDRADVVLPAMRDDMLAAAPHLRAFAISLCGNRDRADDFVQETIAARAVQPAGTRGSSRGAYEAALQPARAPASCWRVGLHLRAGGCDLRDLGRGGQEPDQSRTHAARGAARHRQRRRVRSGPHNAGCFDHGRTGLIGRRAFADDEVAKGDRNRSRRGRQLRRRPLELRDVSAHLLARTIRVPEDLIDSTIGDAQ
jgi:hypothetical protein